MYLAYNELVIYMRIKEYNRALAVDYAVKWALGRNPMYYDFENLGGDCTNFASQCIFAGAGVMNFTPEVGWFYRTANDRTPSWTGVGFLYDFLVSNRSVGPFGRVVPQSAVQVGDIVQLGNQNGRFYHTPVIVSVYPQILVAAHSYDVLNKPLSAYSFSVARFIHIDGVRNW